MGRRKDQRIIVEEESLKLLVEGKHVFSLPETVITKAVQYIKLWSEVFQRHQPKTLAASALYLASLHHRLHVPQRALCEHYDVSLHAVRNFLRKVRQHPP